MSAASDDKTERFRFPHLSHSRIDRYLRCPEQYRLYYIENLRPKFPSASLLFGQLQHQALASLLKDKGDPIRFFLSHWEEARQAELTYGNRQTWEGLRDRGRILLEKFVTEQLPHIGNVKMVEREFQLNITGLDLPFVGIIDLVSENHGITAVTDFKTSASSYAGHEAIMSDQLTAYQLAVPSAQKLGLCLLIKTKEPRIEWHVSFRSGQRLIEYLQKVKLVTREISDQHFYKRPGQWCTSCDYLALCLGDGKKAKLTLTQIK
jgi:CRISPR/Cas system-associated exonuclease Cas4 (RecB family)